MTEGAGGEAASAEDRSWGRWFGRPGRSLTRRLIWLASAWIVLALVMTGWALTSQYHGDGAGMNLLNLQTLDWDDALLDATAPGALGWDGVLAFLHKPRGKAG